MTTAFCLHLRPPPHPHPRPEPLVSHCVISHLLSGLPAAFALLFSHEHSNLGSPFEMKV